VLEEAKRQKEVKTSPASNQTQGTQGDGSPLSRHCGLDSQSPEQSAFPQEMAGQTRHDIAEHPNPQLSTFNFQLSTLKTIPALNVDSALDAMSGLQDVYLDTVKLTVRLLPERIDKMDRFIDTDMKSFNVEVHGLKSVLKNIGATALGNQASSLERAAIEDDKSYCDEHYPSFRSALTELSEQLSAVFPKKDSQLKENADTSELLQAISEAKIAAESFDRDSALGILSPLTDFAHGEEIDELLKEIVFALEAFDCEKALQDMGTVHLSLSNG
jgi:HPt (histidine-containing phosphotransfer) domain-containing protein